MKDRSRKPCVNRRDLLKQLHEILRAACTARCDDRDCHRIGDSTQQLQIEPVLDTVSVDRIDDHLSGTVRHTAADPVNGFHTGIVSAAARKDAEHTVHTFDVDRKHHALPAVTLCCLPDQGRIFDRAGVDADLIRPALQHAVKILQGLDAAADGQGENIGKNPPPITGSGNIIKNQLVRACIAVISAQLHRRGNIAQVLKIDAFDNAPVLHVQTWNNSLGDHFAASNASFKSIAPI